MEVTRDRAWDTLTRYTKSEALLRHALAVEAAVRAYARKLDGDEELWSATALLHDFDYEIHPTLDKHPQDGAAILREEGYPEELIEAVLSHAEHLAMPRDTDLKKTLFACDELAGFIHACGLVRPDGIETLTPKSVKKKLKQPSFAAGVHRDEVYAGAELLGVNFDDHVQTVTDAMKPISKELGLRTAADMGRAIAFYRQLGLEFPDGAESEGHAEATAAGVRIMLDTEETVRSFDPEWKPPTEGHRGALAFRCDTPAEVDSAYANLLEHGGTGHKEPWDAVWGMRYAEVKDPDGNVVDLFADL